MQCQKVTKYHGENYTTNCMGFLHRILVEIQCVKYNVAVRYDKQHFY